MPSLSKRYVCLAASLIVFFAVPADWLELQRTAIIDSGQIWRLITAHWTHLGVAHLILNVAGVLLLAEIFDPDEHWLSWLGCLAGIALAVSASLLLVSPELTWYRGFSGCLHGLFIYEAIRCFSRQKWTSFLVLGAIGVKLLVSGFGVGLNDTEELIGAPVIEMAHVSGAVTGALLALGLIVVAYLFAGSLPRVR